jgi:hypothetical protein
MSERESRDAARSLSVVHYMDRDLTAAAELVSGLVERSGAAEGKPSLIAVLPTPDDALTLGEAVLALRQGANPLTPLTSPTRAKRVIAAGVSSIAADARTIARLFAESRLELTHLQTFVLLWPEEILREDHDRDSLESLMAEIPRSAARVAICTERTPGLAQFLERSLWRAREIEHLATVSARATVPLRVVPVPVSERTRAVRSIVDAFDPDTTALITFSDAAEAAARDTAALLGTSVQTVRGVPDRRFNLGILFDDTPAADALTEIAATVDELIAVIRPSQLAALKRVATNVTPINWTGALANARLTLDALRDEIRSYVSSGGHTAWVPVVEPLLEGLDPVEVAAASLALLDRERRKAKRAAQPAAPAPSAERPVRDERTAAATRPGRRDDDRGRSRRDDDRGRGGGRGFEKKRPWTREGDARGGGGERPRGPRREMADRPPRDYREDRPRREFRDDRPPRGGERGGGRPRDDIERVPRAAREGREWSERGERLRHSRRGPRSRDTE